MTSKSNRLEVGKRLTELWRDRLKIKSSRQFALSIDMDPSMFSKIERGEIGLPEKYAEAISEKYGINVDKDVYGKDVLESIELILAESNRRMAESNYLLAASMQTLIQTNADLTSDIRKERSANAVLGMPLTVAERFASVLKLVAKAGSHGWKTEDEALAEINKVFYAYLKQEEEADTPTAPGK